MRLDQRMVQEGHAPSRSRAQALIADGSVTVDGIAVRKPSDTRQGVICVAADHPWVSRAALKLVHALDVFDLQPHGIALDLGASTGGFTQVLLARGAAHVHAVDVGHGQLHASLAGDPRITLHEHMNARDLAPGHIPVPDWITADLSFISLEKALPAALGLAAPGAWLIALIKPQFEAGPAHVGKGGIVRDPAVHAACCDRIARFLTSIGWTVHRITPSPVTGGDGNKEFLIAARAAAPNGDGA